MEEIPQQEQGNNRTILYIIIGVVVVCGCLALVVGGALAIFGAGLFATTSPTTDFVEFEEEFGDSDPQDEQDAQDDGPLFGEGFDNGDDPQDEPQREPVEPSGELVVEEIPDQGVNHVQIGAPHEAYNSDPPSSGPHYGTWIDPGFYDEVVPDEYLVHNLEHGYIIVWYDCGTLSSSECDGLMSDVEGLIDDLGADKIIGMPREDMPTVIALTSWGHLARLDSFDYDLILEYYDTYLNQSPEPGAP